MSNLNIEKIRSETPACLSRIHFNNAGASLMPDPVYQALTDHLSLERKIGGYEAALQAAEKLECFYKNFADFLNCEPEEIAYTENATRAWDMAFYSIPFKKGDKILTGRAEYASNYLAYLQVAQRLGVIIEVVENDEFGQFSVADLKNKIDSKVKLISISHVPSQGGLVNPAEEIGTIAGESGILYLLDACQSAGQMPLDVKKIGCDFLSGTGRKYLRGPRGTGFLYVRRKLIEELEPPFIDLHSATWVSTESYQLRNDARRFENWEFFVAGKLGLSKAVEYAMQTGLEKIKERVTGLAAKLRDQLSEIPGIQVRDQGQNKCGIVTFQIKGCKPVILKEHLFREGINVSVSPLEYALLDLGARGINELVRASVHYYNTDEEITRFCQFLSTWKGEEKCLKEY